MDRSFSVKCFVPQCFNTTTTKRDKVFVKVPSNLQQEWCHLVGLLHKATSHLYCCEDHLNLQEDLQNYYEWKLMQRTPRLKPTAKLKIPDKDNVTQTLEDAGCKPSKTHQDPKNFKIILKRAMPGQKPIAKLRRICVMPQIGDSLPVTRSTLLHPEPLSQPEPDPGWKPSEAISELQRLLMKKEAPTPRPKAGPKMEKIKWQLEMGTDEGNDSTPTLEAITNSEKDSASKTRLKRTCREEESIVLVVLSDDESSHERDYMDCPSISSELEEDLENYALYKVGAKPKLSLSAVPKNIPNQVIKMGSCVKKIQINVDVATENTDSSCQDHPELQDEDSDSAPIDEDMVEVKEELDDEYKMADPDPLSSSGLALNSMENLNSPVEEEPSPLLGELTEVVVKEETVDPPDIELIDYKALYLKNKEELIRLENENQRLTEENQSLNEKNKNIVNKIEKLLQKHEGRIKNNENDMVIDNNIKNIAEINSNLAKNIDALMFQNQARVREIQELTKKNTSLSAKIQELNDSNRCLTATIEKLKDMNTRKDEEVNVFVQKIQTLSEDVERLKDDNVRLQREIQVTHKRTTDREDRKPLKRRSKRKRKT